MRSHLTRVGLAAVVLTVATAARADGPATRPAAPPTTRAQLLPADQPAVKTNRAGKPDAGFLKRHESFLARGKAGPVGVLFLGDSITDWWSRAQAIYDAHYGSMQPADFGIAGDRTEHVLWRIDNGELDGIHPKVVVLMIGTNNIGDSAAHIVAGDTAIVDQIHRKLPDAKLLLLAIFPRGADPAADPKVADMRGKLKVVNGELAKLADGTRTVYLDIGDKFLDADGKIPKDVMKDALHPTAKGYQIWADAMQPTLDGMMK